MSFLTHTLGFPRIGANRELKFATEKFWQGKIVKEELLQVGRDTRRQNWELQKQLGIDLIPSNDFSFYDQTLDTAALYGVVPERFGWTGKEVDLDLYFAMARGIQEKESESEKV
jgi:5-methyltetrahydropteroyltriglutamate--homocysteine methyltransferase